MASGDRRSPEGSAIVAARGAHPNQRFRLRFSAKAAVILASTGKGESGAHRRAIPAYGKRDKTANARAVRPASIAGEKNP
jgi:hypothetical protein